MSKTITSKIGGIPVKFQLTNDGYKIVDLKSLLKPMTIKHDPYAERYLYLLFFDTLEKLQWHLIRHAFIDNWYQYPSKQPPVLEGKMNKHEIEEYWTLFLSEVKCSRWGKTPEEYRNMRKLLSSDGCHRCSQDHGYSTFKKCVELFNDPLNKFLGRVRGWISDTVQDSKMHKYYKRGVILNNTLNFSRRHVHMEWRKNNVMLAYAICNKNTNERSKEKNVYILKFKIIQNNPIYDIRQTPKNHLIIYQIKTVHGIGTVPEKELAENIIMVDYRNKKPKSKHKTIIHCHPLNWFKMEFPS